MVNPNLESYLLPNYARFIPRRSLPISNQSPHQVSQPPNSNTPSSLTPHPTSQLLPSHPPSTPSSHPLIPCPSPSEFSNALDLPHQRASHQNPNFLNAQFKRGCRCQWSVKQDEGRIEGLLCDFTAHYYHRSKTGAVVRGPARSISSHPPHPSPALPSASPHSSSYDSTSSPLPPIKLNPKPVTWPGLDLHKPSPPEISSTSHPPPTPPHPPIGPPNHQPVLAPILRLPKPNRAHPSKVPSKFSVLKSVSSLQPPEHKLEASHSIIPAATGDSRSTPSHSDAQTPIDRQVSSKSDSISTHPALEQAVHQDSQPPIINPSSHTPSLDVISNQNPTYAPTNHSSLSTGANNLTSTPAANATLGLPKNSATLSANLTGDPNLTSTESSAPQPGDSSHDELTKALGGTFGGIIGLSLLLIAGVLLARRRTTRPRESFAGLRRSRRSSVMQPPMVQLGSGVMASAPFGSAPPPIKTPAYSSDPPQGIMSPADPENRYSANGTGLLTKLQGTTVSFQQAGLISPSHSVEGDGDINASETIAPVLSDGHGGDEDDRGHGTPTHDRIGAPLRGNSTSTTGSIHNPFANERSLSSRNHDSLGTDLSFPGTGEASGMSSGELQPVRFGSNPTTELGSHDQHPEVVVEHPTPDPTRPSRASGDRDQAWWGGTA